MHLSFPQWNKYGSRIILGVILCVYVLNGINYLQAQSITSDEGSFMEYAIRYLKGKPGRIYPVTDNSKMPVTVLNLVPKISEQIIGRATAKQDGGVEDTLNGRYITLFVSLFTILLVFIWSRQLYGEAGGLFSAFLMSLCPNNLAHAGLVTTDSYSSLALLAVMYLLWKFCNTRKGIYFILFAFVMGVSQLVKQSLFHLYILAPLCMLVYFLVFNERFNWSLFWKRVFIFCISSLAIVNLGYYFHQSFFRLGDYYFMSQLFQAFQLNLPASLPMPFPKPFVDGLDMAKYYDQVGGGIPGKSSFGKVTILGQSWTGEGVWYYYFVSIFYKTPVAYFIFLGWSAIIISKIRSIKDFIANEFFLLAPIVYFLVLMSFFYQAQCGIRHIIFIYPFIFICSGALSRVFANKFSVGINEIIVS